MASLVINSINPTNIHQAIFFSDSSRGEQQKKLDKVNLLSNAISSTIGKINQTLDQLNATLDARTSAIGANSNPSLSDLKSKSFTSRLFKYGFESKVKKIANEILAMATAKTSNNDASNYELLLQLYTSQALEPILDFNTTIKGAKDSIEKLKQKLEGSQSTIEPSLKQQLDKEIAELKQSISQNELLHLVEKAYQEQLSSVETISEIIEKSFNEKQLKLMLDALINRADTADLIARLESNLVDADHRVQESTRKVYSQSKQKIVEQALAALIKKQPTYAPTNHDLGKNDSQDINNNNFSQPNSISGVIDFGNVPSHDNDSQPTNDNSSSRFSSTPSLTNLEDKFSFDQEQWMDELWNTFKDSSYEI